jgi:hypothetical protein
MQDELSRAYGVTRARASSFPHLVPVLLPNYKADQIGVLERHRADNSECRVIGSDLRYS